MIVESKLIISLATGAYQIEHGFSVQYTRSKKVLGLHAQAKI